MHIVWALISRSPIATFKHNHQPEITGSGAGTVPAWDGLPVDSAHGLLHQPSNWDAAAASSSSQALRAILHLQRPSRGSSDDPGDKQMPGSCWLTTPWGTTILFSPSRPGGRRQADAMIRGLLTPPGPSHHPQTWAHTALIHSLFLGPDLGARWLETWCPLPCNSTPWPRSCSKCITELPPCLGPEEVAALDPAQMPSAILSLRQPTRNSHTNLRTF
ncbi:hypothetical protein NDU88_001223 [Pleurodeles waltl]|uniref:Uncharacterized protein n=1 Tax=Pleurodeles waltl TaxID=8319 RepID=A0AAV7VB21_PLEWA|nr:hypothetical protein NDU88_001223 [Pleurodeles waltl]